MILCALKNYVPDERLKRVTIPLPEKMPSVAIYHPDAPRMFESFEKYSKWYKARRPKSNVQSPTSPSSLLDPESTIWLLLMRPQVISRATKHYDQLIRSIEAEGLSVIPVLATLMDNREACEKFFVREGESKVQNPKFKVKTKDQRPKAQDHSPYARLMPKQARISQLVSLTGFSLSAVRP